MSHTRPSLACLSLAVLALAAPAHAGAPDQARLRRLARLPQLDVSVSYNVNDFDLCAPQPNHSAAANVALLRQRLQRHPGDAEATFRLSRVYQVTGDAADAKTFLGKSLWLYARSVKARPGDGVLLAEYSDALFTAERPDEAAGAARRATELAPQAWQPWAYLGQAVSGQAWHFLFGKGAWENISFTDPSRYQQLLAGMVKNRPDPAQIAHAETLLREGQDDVDKAVALAPQQPRPVVVRGGVHFLSGLYVRRALQVLHGEAAPTLTAKTFLDSLGQLALATRLLPDDVNAVAFSAFYPALSAAAGDASGQSSAPPFWSRMSDSEKRQTQAGLDRLAVLARDQDAATASAAEGARGFLLSFVVGRNVEAEAALRHAIALDPANDKAWDSLIGLLGSARHYADAVTLLQTRLKTENTAQNHLYLAKAYDGSGRPAEAEAEARAALKLAPQDLSARLTLAALLLRRNGPGGVQDAAALREAAQVLTDMHAAVSKSSSTSLAADYDLDTGIAAALAGQADVAKAYFDTVLAQDASDADARSALAALSGGAAPPAP